LPPTGGHRSAHVRDFNFKGIISFKSARVDVTGNEYEDKDNKNARTYATRIYTTIEDLNILDMVTADRVVTRLASEHKADSEPQPAFIPTGSSFDNLKIAGYPIHVEFGHDIFSHHRTYNDFTKDLKDSKNPACKDCYECILGSRIPDDAPVHLHPLRDRYRDLQKNPANDGGMVLCSIVKNLQHPNTSDLKVHGPIIVVPHFGTVYLGQYLLQPHGRLLSMIRVAMGSPDSGVLDVGFGDGSGLPYPPH
jgi:hypothetical protein